MRIFLIGLSESLARSVARYVYGDPTVALSGVAPSLALAAIMLPVSESALALVDWAVLAAAPGHGLQELHQCSPALRVVCVLDEIAPYRAAALSAGADAVISRDGFGEELEALLRGPWGEFSRTCGVQHV